MELIYYPEREDYTVIDRLNIRDKNLDAFMKSIPSNVHEIMEWMFERFGEMFPRDDYQLINPAQNFLEESFTKRENSEFLDERHKIEVRFYEDDITKCASIYFSYKYPAHFETC